MKTSDRPTKVNSIALLCVGDVSLSAAILITEPFRSANRLSERDRFEIDHLSLEGEVRVIRNEVTFRATPLSKVGKLYDIALLLACYEVNDASADAAISWIRNQARHGALVGAIDYAPVLLAKAGLLDGYKATAHWVTRDVFVERFPNVDICEDLFVIDRLRATSPGQIASIELSLEILERYTDQALAQLVQNDLIYSRRSDRNFPQKAFWSTFDSKRDVAFDRAAQAMLNNTSTPLSIEEISDISGLGVRELQRRFKKYVQSSPLQFYMKIRLQKARDLILFGKISIQDVALAVGFSSYGTFHRAFKAQFGMPPGQAKSAFKHAPVSPNGRRVF